MAMWRWGAYGGYGGWGWLGMIFMLAVFGIVVWAFVTLLRRQGGGAPYEREENRILKQRLARGEITDEEYDRLQQKLR